MTARSKPADILLDFRLPRGTRNGPRQPQSALQKPTQAVCQSGPRPPGCPARHTLTRRRYARPGPSIAASAASSPSAAFSTCRISPVIVRAWWAVVSLADERG